ncbi:AraC family transcriptional regulator [Paenibacillus sp. J2TS4]|uniref:AraC family transcriptional regulator n=1 Tax=Paenibacillus sp. J2TS4 TaxID=2807194 RepID=UPI001B1A2B0F|nr:AraC family transcriptional regulator [Paenibacillus sp. J2TS4]GIP33521.1 hypothetical protein J2TS4_27310 [Paenibacillus sp. J2TS4]
MKFRNFVDTKIAFRKYLILFFITVLVPTVLLLTLQIYNKYQDTLQQADAISEAVRESASRNLELLLEQMGQMTLQISMSPDVLELLTRPYDLPAYRYAETKDQLGTWMDSNSLFESIYLDIRLNEKVMTVREGLYDRESFYDKTFLKEITQLSSEYSRSWVGVRQYPGSSGKEVLSFVRSVPVTEKTALGYLVVNVDKTKFMNILMNINSQMSGQLIVADPENHLVSSSFEGIDAQKLLSKITPGIVYTDVIKLDGMQYSLNGLKSASNNWTLLKVTPISPYMPALTGAIRQAMLILVIVLLLGIGMSYLFASILYNPWKHLATTLQGYVMRNTEDRQDAYTVVNRAIHNLIAKIHQNEPIVRDHVVYDWLHNQYPDDIDTPAQRFAEAGIHFVSPHHAVLVVVDENTRDPERASGDTLFLFSLTEDELHSRFMAAGTMIDSGKFAFILNFDRNEFDAELMAELEDACRSIQQKAHKRLKAELGFFVSGIQPLSHLSEAFEQVKRAMAYKAFLPQSAVCFVEESNESGQFQYPASYQKKIINFILAGDRDRVEQYMTELFEQYLQSSAAPYPKLLQMIIMLMSHILGSLAQEGYDIEPLLDQVDLLQLQQCQNQRELKMMLLLQIGQIMDYLCMVGKQTEDSNPMVSQALAYIDNHYASNLSIADVASLIGISPSHLSRIFKAEVGKSPIEYLTELRVSASKTLLKDKAKSLQQISESIGYNDANTFIRTFKKAEGMTPGEYRKKVINHS